MRTDFFIWIDGSKDYNITVAIEDQFTAPMDQEDVDKMSAFLKDFYKADKVSINPL